MSSINSPYDDCFRTSRQSQSLIEIDDVMEGDEPFYYLSEYEQLDIAEFDQESWQLFHEMGF